jgi:hypothetical protein
MTPPETTMWRRWVGFWFSPTDPSTMAFIRIVTGLLVIYTHVCYSYDLTAFFGKDAWYDLETANRERREAPARFGSASKWEWNDRSESAILPDEPHRRKAIVNWIRALPEDKAELRKKLRLIDHRGILDGSGGNGYTDAQIRAGSAYLFTLGPDKNLREGTLKAFVDKSLRNDKELFPPPLDVPLDSDRKAIAADLEALAGTLPGTMTTLADERRYVTNYFFELDPILRYNLVKFLRDLPADAAAREAQIEYLNYWNYERRYADRVGTSTFSFWYHITDPTEMVLAHSVVLFVMVLFTLGLFTRVTSVLTWVASVSYISRDPQVLFGQDTMQNILLIYLMIANCGATFSLDRLIDRYRAARASLARSGTLDPATQSFLLVPPPSLSCGFAQRAFQVHFCFIYMASGMSKLKGAGWWNHGALWDTIANPEFTMIQYAWYQDMLRIISTQRPVYAGIAAVSVYFTLFTELSLPFLVWTRLRPYIITFGFALHTGIGIIMGLLVFSLFMMTMLLVYVPGSMIRAQFSTPRPTSRILFRFDARSRTQARAAALVAAADISGAVDLVDTPGATLVTLSIPGQPDASGEAAASAAFRTIGALKWVKPLAFVPGVGAKLTGLVAGM